MTALHTEQLALWRSTFGREYTDRNDHEKPERVESGGACSTASCRRGSSRSAATSAGTSST